MKIAKLLHCIIFLRNVEKVVEKYNFLVFMFNFFDNDNKVINNYFLFYF